MTKTVSFFDFDQTVIASHSRYDHSMEAYHSMATAAEPVTPASMYESGKKYAIKNLKSGIQTSFLHDLTHISAIATYHNNPAFIAGCIATLLGKELGYNETILSDKGTVIDSYSIVGADKDVAPILISYIPATGRVYEAAVTRLRGKNEQIDFLRKTLLERGLITDDLSIHFFDDDVKNIQEANKRLGIVTHLVSKKASEFVFTDGAKHGKGRRYSFEEDAFDELIARGGAGGGESTPLVTFLPSVPGRSLGVVTGALTQAETATSGLGAAVGGAGRATSGFFSPPRTSAGAAAHLAVTPGMAQM